MVSPTYVHLGTFKQADLDESGQVKLVPQDASVFLDVFHGGTSSDDPVPRLLVDDGLRSELIPEGPATHVSAAVWHRKYRLVVGLDGAKPPGIGAQTRSISAETVDGSNAGVVVAWRVDRPLVAIPATLNFGRVGAGERIEPLRLVIQSSEGKPFRILKAEDHDGVVA